jgi:hypothetical protein
MRGSPDGTVEPTGMINFHWPPGLVSPGGGDQISVDYITQTRLARLDNALHSLTGR